MRDRALSRLASLSLPDRAERDVLVALRRVDPAGQTPLALAAADGRLEQNAAIERLACTWVLAAAINVADDLADGDATYLDSRAVPGVAFLLQAFFVMLAANAGVSTKSLGSASRALVLAAAGQSLEVRTERWDAATYQVVANHIGGHQYAAHLALLWDGTRLESRAASVGMCMGRAGMVAKDCATRDPRFWSMSEGDRQAVKTWALEGLAAARDDDSRSVRWMTEYARPLIR